MDVIESKIKRAKERLGKYEKRLLKLEQLEKEKEELAQKFEEMSEKYSKQLGEKDQIISEQGQLIAEQMQMMQKMEEDINKLEGHIMELTSHINKENRDISYLQEQLKQKESQIAEDKQKRDQNTNAMIFKYASMKNVDSPKRFSGNGAIGMNSMEFANYTSWDQIQANSLSFKSIDIDDWVCHTKIKPIIIVSTFVNLFECIVYFALFCLEKWSMHSWYFLFVFLRFMFRDAAPCEMK